MHNRCRDRHCPHEVQTQRAEVSKNFDNIGDLKTARGVFITFAIFFRERKVVKVSELKIVIVREKNSVKMIKLIFLRISYIPNFVYFLSNIVESFEQDFFRKSMNRLSGKTSTLWLGLLSIWAMKNPTSLCPVVSAAKSECSIPKTKFASTSFGPLKRKA